MWTVTKYPIFWNLHVSRAHVEFKEVWNIKCSLLLQYGILHKNKNIWWILEVNGEGKENLHLWLGGRNCDIRKTTDTISRRSRTIVYRIPINDWKKIKFFSWVKSVVLQFPNLVKRKRLEFVNEAFVILRSFLDDLNKLPNN